MRPFDPPPDLVAELARRWRLDLGAPLAHDGVLGWVAPAGPDRVLKLARLHDEGTHEAEGLAVWDGNGTVRLHDSWTDGTLVALLLERAVPGTPLSDQPPEEQDEVLAGLLQRLWIDPPAGHPFRPLTQMCGWWADEAAAQGVPAGFHDGLELFRTLPDSAPRTVLLGTDTHAGNVLAARREPWLVIDPKPYVGDPHYDVLQHLLNDDVRLHADAIGWCERMARLLDLDADRLRQWLFARCVQESPDRPDLLEVARRLR